MSKSDTATKLDLIRNRVLTNCKRTGSSQTTSSRKRIHLKLSPICAAVFMATELPPNQAHAESGYVNVCTNSGKNSASNSYSSLNNGTSANGCGFDSSLGGLSATIIIANRNGSSDAPGSLTMFSEGTLRYSGPQAIFRSNVNLFENRILRLARGIDDTDASNMEQLGDVASALGGGALFTSNGSLTNPSYKVQSKTSSTVGGAISDLDSAITSTNQSVSKVDSRVNDTNRYVSNVDSLVTTLTSNIRNGTIGLMQQAKAGSNITVAKDTDGDKVDFAGTFKEPVSPGSTQTRNVVKDRLLTGVKAGVANNDAANMSQLKNVASALGGDATFTSDGSLTNPSYQIQRQSYSNVGEALSAIDTNFTNLSSDLQSGTIGLVQQAKTGSNITVAKDTDGDKVDFAGTFEQSANDDQKNKAKLKKSRVLTGIAAGNDDSDAVSVAQLRKTGLLDDNGDSLNAVIYDSASKDSVTLGGGVGGTVLANVAPGLIGHDSMQAVNGGQLYTLREDIKGQINGLDKRVNILETKVIGDESGNIDVGRNQTGKPGGNTVSTNAPSGDREIRGENLATDNDRAGRINNVDLGNDNTTHGSHSLGIGNGNTVNGSNSIAQGSNNAVTGSRSVAVGYGNQVGEYSQSIGNNNTIGNRGLTHGNNNTVVGDGSMAVGHRNKVSGNNSVAIGFDNNLSGENDIGLGNGTQVSGNNSAAIGTGAMATASNAVALGSDSLADRENAVSVGSTTNLRQITHVAAGTQPTDAANLGQVQDYVNTLQSWTNHRFQVIDRQINRIGAMGAAYNQMSINAAGVQPGKGRIAVGIGFQSGQSAMALGYAKAINERARVSVGVAFSSSVQSMGAGFGVDI